MEHQITKNFDYREVISNRLRTPWYESISSQDKPILMFFHGFPDGPEVFSSLAEELKSDFNIVMPFTRGVGASQAADRQSRYSSTSILLDHMKVLQSLNLNKNTPIFCVGHDLGGFHAIAMAEHLGARCAGLVLMSTMSIRQMWKQIRKPRQLLKSWYVGFMQLPVAPKIVTNKLPGIIHAYVKKLSKDRDWQPSTNGSYVANSDSHYKEIFKEAVQSRKTQNIQLNCPVLAMWGDKDPFLEIPNKNSYGSLSDDVTMRIFKGDHWFFHKQTAKVHQVLKDFIEVKMKDKIQ